MLSSGLKWKYSWPHNQLRCRLFVYADAVEKGWVRTISGNTLTAMGATVESQTEFPDAAEFLWGLHGPYSGFPTLKFHDKTVALDKATMQSLTLQKSGAGGYIDAGWAPPELQDPKKIRPMELQLQDVKGNLKYCTPRGGQTVILAARAIGDPNYGCVDAVVFVRFIYTESVDEFPQKVKIGLYEENLNHFGWLSILSQGPAITYGGPDDTYGSASEFTLIEESLGQFSIHFRGGFLRTRTSEDTGDAVPVDSFGFYKDGTADSFQWANGNPHQIVPVVSWPTTLFRCDRVDGSLRPVFRIDPVGPDEKSWTCSNIRWIISVTS